METSSSSASSRAVMRPRDCSISSRESSRLARTDHSPTASPDSVCHHPAASPACRMLFGGLPVIGHPVVVLVDEQGVDDARADRFELRRDREAGEQRDAGGRTPGAAAPYDPRRADRRWPRTPRRPTRTPRSPRRPPATPPRSARPRARARTGPAGGVAARTGRASPPRRRAPRDRSASAPRPTPSPQHRPTGTPARGRPRRARRPRSGRARRRGPRPPSPSAGPPARTCAARADRARRLRPG